MAHFRMSDSLTGGDRRVEPQTPLRSTISGVTRVWSSGSVVVTGPPARTVDGQRTASFQHLEPGRPLSSATLLLELRSGQAGIAAEDLRRDHDAVLAAHEGGAAGVAVSS